MGSRHPQYSLWHKYVVTQVVEHDKSGASPDVVHGYAYDIKVDGLRADGVGAIGSNSGVLWHYDTNAIGSDTSHRTWSQFRGFAVVSEFTGTTVTGSPRTRTVRLYFTGLNADRTAAGEGTRTGMTIVDTDMAAIPDEWWRAGALRQELTFPDDQGTSKPIVKTFHDPSAGTVTATRTITSAWLPSATTTAMFAPTVGDETWTWLAASSTWRKSRSETTYDSDLSDGAYGSVLARSTLGDLSTAADDSCTTYTYNVNVGGNLVRFDGSGTGPTVGTVLADWTGYDRTTATKDFDGDGKTDLFAVQKSTGNLYLFKGDGVGGFDAGTSIASGWNAYDAVIAPGDFTNDGKTRRAGPQECQR